MALMISTGIPQMNASNYIKDNSVYNVHLYLLFSVWGTKKCLNTLMST